MSIGERIRSKRLELGFTQAEIADKLGYKSRSSVNKMETSRTLPLSKVTRMAEVLNCTPIYLMGWEEPYSNKLVELLEKLTGIPEVEKLLTYYISLPDEERDKIIKYSEDLARIYSKDSE